MSEHTASDSICARAVTVAASSSVTTQVPVSDLGFRVPAGGRAEFRAFVIEGEPSAPPLSIVSTDAYDTATRTWMLVPIVLVQINDE